MKLGCFGFLGLFTFILSVSGFSTAQAAFFSDRLEEDKVNNSFAIHGAARFLNESDLGSDNSFSKPGAPEVGFQTGFLRRSFLLEPSLGFKFKPGSSRTLSTASSRVKSTYHLIVLHAGFRQYFFTPEYFPIVPFAEAYATGNLMLFEKKTTNTVDNSKVTSNFNGIELGATVGGGFNLSFVAFNKGLGEELDSVWKLQDYGFQAFAQYFVGDFFRTGNFKSLGSTKSITFGGGLYVTW